MNSSVWAVWAVWAAQAVRGKKVDLSFSEQLLMVFFSTFCGQKYCSVRTKKLHSLSFIKKIDFDFFLVKLVYPSGFDSQA